MTSSVSAARRAFDVARVFEGIGPLSVKLAQLLSTREDLIPTSVAQQLGRLQRRCDPLDYSEVMEALAMGLGRSVERVFRSVEEQPLGSGSIAQVHAAVLLTGERVAVKVRRPNVEAQMASELGALRGVTATLDRLGLGKNLPWEQILDEVVPLLTAQCDLRREAASALTLAGMLESNHYVRLPDTHDEHSTDAVMIMEALDEAMPIEVLLQADLEARRAMTEALVELVYEMLFDRGLVHADLHPGNLGLDVDGRWVLFDFGC